jgi:hypothetical protein
MGELASARGVPSDFGAAGPLVAPAGCDSRRRRPTWPLRVLSRPEVATPAASMWAPQVVATGGYDTTCQLAGPTASRNRRTRYVLIASAGYDGVLILRFALN